MDDGTILDLFFERDEAGIEEAKHKYSKRLFMIAKNILRSNEDAEECVNDTLLKAWNSIPPNRPQMLGAYLSKITRNRSLNRWEERNAAKRGGGEVTQLLGELGESVPAPNTTEQAYDETQTTAAINIFLAKADKTARILFVLRYFHGESITGISARLKMNENRIKSTLFRLRKKLRSYLEKEGITL
ncbi:MAG: RNA polymerase sigma factor [Defluviitaleaceae bacterium]|nr:RNA polymerase sigma factor [Defluviitaleaceae bacterium]